MIIVKTSVWQYLGYLLYILGSSLIFKISLKTFKNNKSLLYNHLCAEETNF